MDHLICLNDNSFPAENKNDAISLFTEAIYGLLEVNTGSDRFILYIDKINSLRDLVISENFTFNNYLQELENRNEIDLLSFLTELEDKCPMLDHLNEEVFEQAAGYSFYIPDSPFPHNPDILSIAYFLNAILLSIETSNLWYSQTLKIIRTTNGRFLSEYLELNNISNTDHGKFHFKRLHELKIEDSSDKCIFSDEFKSWFSQQSQENKVRIFQKLELAHNKEFNGGEPLFSSLNNAFGMREIRFSAYPGGAIRILFKAARNAQQIILIGFIKKSNAEGYEQNINEAKEILEKLNC